MEERNYCVYKHTSPSNKVYIGITCQKPEHRWGKDGNGYIRCTRFYNAIQKYGWDNILHEILFTNLSKEEACEKEIELIAFYKSNQREFGYNLSLGGESGTNGYHHTEDVKARMSETHKGQKLSDEQKRKMSESAKGKFHWWQVGKHLSEETRQKIGNAQRGELNHMWGKHHSEERNKKVSIAVKEWKLKMSTAYKEYKANGGLLKWNEFQKEFKKQSAN